MKSDINVTPLVDVVLVLLIIFMVVTPMMQRGRDVALPRASNPSKGSPGDPLVLSLQRDRSLYVESERTTDAAQAQERLARELQAQPGRRLRLKADQELTCGDVRKVLELASAAGAKGMALAVEEPEHR